MKRDSLIFVNTKLVVLANVRQLPEEQVGHSCTVCKLALTLGAITVVAEMSEPSRDLVE